MLEEALVRLAGEEDLTCAWSAVKPLTEEAHALTSRFQEGFPADLGLSPVRLEALADPRVVFPWARSVVSFVQPIAAFPIETGRPTGQIAPFAAFGWYDRLKEKLKRIRLSLRALFPDLHVKGFVEGGLLEKAWALRSSLGWRGRHSIVLHPAWGSRFLLGELLLSEPLENAGRPQEDRCGDCRRCLEACPTHALEAPYRVRPERCLDTWTLHHPGPLPETVRAILGTRLFGCDACQAACPMNWEVPFPATDPPPGPGPTIVIDEALRFTEEEYRARFNGHTFARVPFSQFLRNTLCIAGNTGDSRLEDSVRPFLENRNTLLNEQAAWSLARLETDRGNPLPG